MSNVYEHSHATFVLRKQYKHTLAAGHTGEEACLIEYYLLYLKISSFQIIYSTKNQHTTHIVYLFFIDKIGEIA